jgi:hypothetical protein
MNIVLQDSHALGVRFIGKVVMFYVVVVHVFLYWRTQSSYLFSTVTFIHNVGVLPSRNTGYTITLISSPFAQPSTVACNMLPRFFSVRRENHAK